MGQRVASFGGLSCGFLGDRLRKTLTSEGVDLGYCPVVDAPTTLGLVGLAADGSASYDFYGAGCADRLVKADDLPDLGDDVRALHFGSMAMVVEPVVSALRVLVDRERGRRLISYDPNLRLNVEPDLGRWTATLPRMASRSVQKTCTWRSQGGPFVRLQRSGCGSGATWWSSREVATV